ncbi:MAG: endonuclease/exonuclease/phosphatase family protein [Cytophagales bacterium]|nr:endonuclease/exonuclease/phosphatase family protein [Bernardetiaceae bacterium]MDW8205282.1 endonuclease/exonuclease/phosphatase family protein [Cytophagales bacterium]
MTKKAWLSGIFWACLILHISAQSLQERGIALPEGYRFPQKNTFTILSWNVEHFVDEFDNPYIRNEREDVKDSQAQAEVQRKIALLVKALRQANADIVVLQEFESMAFLRQIAREHLADMGYQFFAASESPDWYMNVVIMSRYPMGITYGYRSLYTPLPGIKNNGGEERTQININSRIVAQEIFIRPDLAFLLTGVHLKAGRNQEDVATRIGQIKAIQYQLLQLKKRNKHLPMVLAGDFNSLEGSAEMNELLHKNNPLQWRDPWQGKNALTHPADNPERRLDYILANKIMAKWIQPQTAIIGGLFADEPTAQRTMSDHLPVQITFSIPTK